MPRFLIAVIVALACAGTLSLAVPEAEAAPTKMERKLVAKINEARAARGLRKLRVGAKLQRGAHSWSVRLRRASAFYHARLGPGIGENLAWGTCNWMRPLAAVRMWLKSPAHRRLLLRPGFRYVGAGWNSGRWRGFGCVEMAVARFR